MWVTRMHWLDERDEPSVENDTAPGVGKAFNVTTPAMTGCSGRATIADHADPARCVAASLIAGWMA